jgi:hypothetical protein
MNTVRDPRIQPRHGDTVTVSGETREVEQAGNDRVIYSWPGKIAVRTLSLTAWRAWAANASGYQASDMEACDGFESGL